MANNTSSSRDHVNRPRYNVRSAISFCPLCSLFVLALAVLWIAVPVIMVKLSSDSPTVTEYIDADGNCVNVINGKGSQLGCDFIQGKRVGIDYVVEHGASKEMRDEQRRYEQRQRFEKEGAVEM